MTTLELLSLAYAIEQARRNLVMDRAEAVPRLQRLTAAVSTNRRAPRSQTPGERQSTSRSYWLTIHGKADYLPTGDARHFEHLYGKRIEGVLVLRPARVLNSDGSPKKAQFSALLRIIKDVMLLKAMRVGADGTGQRSRSSSASRR